MAGERGQGGEKVSPIESVPADDDLSDSIGGVDQDRIKTQTGTMS